MNATSEEKRKYGHGERTMRRVHLLWDTSLFFPAAVCSDKTRIRTDAHWLVNSVLNELRSPPSPLRGARERGKSTLQATCNGEDKDRHLPWPLSLGTLQPTLFSPRNKNVRTYHELWRHTPASQNNKVCTSIIRNLETAVLCI